MEYILLGIAWLVSILTIIIFFLNAKEKDTRAKREQEYIDMVGYLNNKNKNKGGI